MGLLWGLGVGFWGLRVWDSEFAVLSRFWFSAEGARV